MPSAVEVVAASAVAREQSFEAFELAVSLALCVTAWRSLFGFQRQSIALVLLAAVAVWLLRGIVESSVMAGAMVILAARAHRRELGRHPRED